MYLPTPLILTLRAHVYTSIRFMYTYIHSRRIRRIEFKYRFKIQICTLFFLLRYPCFSFSVFIVYIYTRYHFILCMYYVHCFISSAKVYIRTRTFMVFLLNKSTSEINKTSAGAFR